MPETLEARKRNFELEDIEWISVGGRKSQGWGVLGGETQ